MDEKSKAKKYSDEYNEAIDINDILQQKKKEMASTSDTDKKEVQTESKNSDNQNQSFDVKEHKKKLLEMLQKDPASYMKFLDQAKKDYKQYKDAKEKAETVDRAPAFANFPGYATAKNEVKQWEIKYPDFKDYGISNYELSSLY